MLALLLDAAEAANAGGLRIQDYAILGSILAVVLGGMELAKTAIKSRQSSASSGAPSEHRAAAVEDQFTKTLEQLRESFESVVDALQRGHADIAAEVREIHAVAIRVTKLESAMDTALGLLRDLEKWIEEVSKRVHGQATDITVLQGRVSGNDDTLKELRREVRDLSPHHSRDGDR